MLGIGERFNNITQRFSLPFEYDPGFCIILSLQDSPGKYASNFSPQRRASCPSEVNGIVFRSAIRIPAARPKCLHVLNAFLAGSVAKSSNDGHGSATRYDLTEFQGDRSSVSCQLLEFVLSSD